MKVVLRVDKGKAKNVLQLTNITEPEIVNDTDVKIKIKAAGVNPIDTKVRINGGFYQGESTSFILGCDGAGEIVSVGIQVNDFKVGDQVWFCHGGLGKEQGNYAEYTVIDRRWIALKPKQCSFVEAAAMPLALITAWNALFEKGNLQKNETVLIHAGAGGVGHLAIQLAKLKGARVITTVSSEEKVEFVKSLGADFTIDYTKQDFLEEVNSLTRGGGCNLIIDTVGSKVFKDSIPATCYFGKLITLLDPGVQDLSEARMRNLLIGFELMLTPMLKNLSVARDKHINILRQCAEWVDNGTLKVHVSDTLPLNQAALAHNKIEKGHTIGKIVLEID
ncbi:MAG: zinc-dependent alcohol dehydrogenase family protein [Methylococcales bacterium]|nr:zinc-dependent alcohol dehydrogenase family protein [Methylococcales bacterium]